MNFDYIVNFIGLFGGILLGICLFPQVYKTIKTKSTKDISLEWQILYSIGLSLIYIYALYYQLWPMYIPATFEIICIYFLTIYKIYNDGCSFSYQNNNLSSNVSNV